jgi:hypothetical protein
MLFSLIGVFAALCFLSLLLRGPERNRPLLLIGTSVLLFLIAVLRPPTFDRDYNSYIDLFYRESAYDHLEPTFRLVSGAIHAVFRSQIIFLFLFYAAVGLAVKMRGVALMAHDHLSTLIVFVSNYYLYHDLTQIRASVGVGFLFLAVYYIFHRRLRIASALFLIAVLFHYSLLIGAPLLFLHPVRIRRWYYIGAIITAYILASLGLGMANIFGFLQEQLPFLEYKIGANAVVAEMTEIVPVKLYNWMQLLRIAIALLLMYRMGDCLRVNRYSVLLLKLYVFAIISLALFSDNGVYAFRLSQLFAYGEVLLIPMAAHILCDGILARAVVIAYALVILWYNLYYVGLFQF